MLVVSLVSLPQASPQDQQASAWSLAAAQHETPAPTSASRKQIVRRLYEDALAWEQGKQSRETGGQNVAVALGHVAWIGGGAALLAAAAWLLRGALAKGKGSGKGKGRRRVPSAKKLR